MTEWASAERQGREWAQDMTLGEAVTLLAGFEREPWACACVGPPQCCRYRFDQAKALRRGAEIAAGVIRDAARVSLDNR
jgi:hypothetical protein